MDRKITLILDAGVIDKAKGYARSRGISLSEMIENYLSMVVEKEDKENSFTPTVNRLIGIIDTPVD